MRLNKIIIIFTTLFVILSTNTSILSKSKLRVGIATFDSSSIKNVTELEDNLTNTIIEHLEQKSATIITLNRKQLKLPLENKINIKTIKEIIAQYDLDCFIWGNFIDSENNYTINTNMLNNCDNSKIVQITEKGTDIANIAKKMAEKLNYNLFGNNIISTIEIVGNFRIEENAIFELMETKTGDNYEKNKISTDIKAIYNMGCFEHISVEHKHGPNGLIISIRVKESPIINKISFFKNKKFDKEKIKNNINLSEGSFLNFSQIKQSIEKIKNMYKEANYHDIKIDYTLDKLDKNQVKLNLIFTEGKKIFINKIQFLGNNTYKTKILKKSLKSSEKGKLSWLTSSGILNEYFLLQDTNLLLSFYHSKGFINIKVGKPIITIKHGNCSLLFQIEEGERFSTGKCYLKGDLILPETEIYQMLQMPHAKWFNIHAIRQDIFKLKKIYSNAGFPNAEVSTETNQHPDNTMDLTYVIKKNTQVTIKNIEISGNIITHDNVIRRELKINENSIYNKDNIEMSLYNLRKLNYFENSTVEQLKCNDISQIGLNFKVKEKPTGQISFGAGYSSTDKFFVHGLISQANLFGRGQTIKISGTLGSGTDSYDLTFNEPWLFGLPFSGTVQLYKQIDEEITSQDENDLDNSKKYKKIDTGLYLGIGYPLSNFVRTSLGYNYNISEEDKSEKDKTSSVTLAMRYDSRDGSFYTKKGMKHLITCTYAGLGGNLSYLKVESELGCYIPLSKKFTLFLRSKYGRIEDLHKNRSKYKQLPDKKLFRLGGMDSIRAYDYKTIGTTELEGNGKITGGSQYILFNAELIYPIYEELNLLGVIFYDTGEVFNHHIDKLKNGAGCGIRWFSPIGPIRLEVAYKLNNLEDKIKWNFSIGSPF